MIKRQKCWNIMFRIQKCKFYLFSIPLLIYTHKIECHCESAKVLWRMKQSHIQKDCHAFQARNDKIKIFSGFALEGSCFSNELKDEVSRSEAIFDLQNRRLLRRTPEDS